MKRHFLGLDLGTKTCGVCQSDISNTIIVPKCTIRFPFEKYDILLEKLKRIIEEENITDIAIGLPLNMDGTKGFAAQRTINFAEKLKEFDVTVGFIDERLTTMQSAQVLHDCNLKEKDFKDKVDMEAACLILEVYMRKVFDEEKHNNA